MLGLFITAASFLASFVGFVNFALNDSAVGYGFSLFFLMMPFLVSKVFPSVIPHSKATYRT